MSHEWKHPSYYKELARIRKEFEKCKQSQTEEKEEETERGENE
jgi:hypothetical protein|tara:strand:+ start:214 stop:342 length:129 start_codon:yes stop_codon:yes gene_type:complete